MSNDRIGMRNIKEKNRLGLESVPVEQPLNSIRNMKKDFEIQCLSENDVHFIMRTFILMRSEALL